MKTEIVNNIRKRDIYLLSYDKSGSKHLYLKYCKMRNLVQWDVKSQNKYIYIIYIYIYMLKMLLKIWEQLSVQCFKMRGDCSFYWFFYFFFFFLLFYICPDFIIKQKTTVEIQINIITVMLISESFVLFLQFVFFYYAWPSNKIRFNQRKKKEFTSYDITIREGNLIHWTMAFDDF